MIIWGWVMRKIFYLLLIISISCTGCLKQETKSSTKKIAVTKTYENQTKTSLSPTGKYRAEAYGTNHGITYGGLYPYEGIRVVEVDSGEVLWKMSGYYVVNFTWSVDGRYVGIYYEGRICGDSIVFDTQDKKVILLPKLSDIAPHYGEKVRPQAPEKRPDPYFIISGWQKPETVIVDFKWAKEIQVDENPFKGQFTYNIKTKKVSYK